MSKVEVVGSWVGLIGVLIGGHQLVAGLIPLGLGLVTILAGVYLIVYMWPFNSSWGES